MLDRSETSGVIDSALLDAERRGEVVAALFRFLIFGAILIALWGELGPTRFNTPMIAIVVAYGLASLAGLGMAYWKIYHPTLPYIFVLVDLAVLAVSMVIVARSQGMGMSLARTLPLFSIAFIVLIHASLRYRPSLVVFGAMLFVGLTFVLPELPWLGLAVQPGTTHRGGMASTAMPGLNTLTPLLFVSVAAVLLYYTVRRTRSLLVETLRDSRQMAQLSRFFSPDLARRLASGEYGSTETGSRQNVAVMFIDIRGFTRIAMTMNPQELSHFLSEFRETVCEIIFRHGGTVDKFIGDAVLAVFGTPTSQPDDARRSIEAAFEVARGVRAWADSQQDMGKAGALVGIGVHYGSVFAGVIRSGEILEHTVIGDVVNLAQRLERVTRTLDTDVVLSRDVLRASGQTATELNLSMQDNVELAGYEERFVVYHLKLDHESA